MLVFVESVRTVFRLFIRYNDENQTIHKPRPNRIPGKPEMATFRHIKRIKKLSRSIPSGALEPSETHNELEDIVKQKSSRGSVKVQNPKSRLDWRDTKMYGTTLLDTIDSRLVSVDIFLNVILKKLGLKTYRAAMKPPLSYKMLAAQKR